MSLEKKVKRILDLLSDEVVMSEVSDYRYLVPIPTRDASVRVRLEIQASAGCIRLRITDNDVIVWTHHLRLVA